MTADLDVAKIEAWLKVTKMAESRLGLLACANPRAVERIRNGGATLNTLRQVMDYIAAHPAKGGRK